MASSNALTETEDSGRGDDDDAMARYQVWMVMAVVLVAVLVSLASFARFRKVYSCDFCTLRVSSFRTQEKRDAVVGRFLLSDVLPVLK